MKTLILSLLVVSSFSLFSSEVPRFSAFSDGTNLHITVMGDTCNRVSGFLDVSSRCKASRVIENYALSCTAELRMMATELACSDDKLIPQVFSINITKADIAREAKSLTLVNGDQEITIAIDPRN